MLLSCCILLSACGGQEHFSYAPLKYAELLRICRTEKWTGVEVLDAWHRGEVLHRYILVPRAEDLPEDLPEGTLVRTPLQRAVAFSSVHGGLFCDLGCADGMVGICDAGYVMSDTLRQRLADGRLADLGSSMQVDLERMAQARPDAFFVSPFENAGYGALPSMGLPLIECADYMETSPLGRAEWMKFYGMLMGCEVQADRLFAEVERSYKDLCNRVRSGQDAPSLLCDLKQGSAWYVPGGNSYLGRLFADAGVNYLFSGREESGSVALSFEAVLACGHDADGWIVKYGARQPLTYRSLLEENPLYGKFRPWREKKIWGCNTMQVPYYEEVPFHPDFLLRDLIRIFHPEVLPEHKLKYYFPLSE